MFLSLKLSWIDPGILDTETCLVKLDVSDTSSNLGIALTYMILKPSVNQRVLHKKSVCQIKAIQKLTEVSFVPLKKTNL